MAGYLSPTRLHNYLPPTRLRDYSARAQLHVGIESSQLALTPARKSSQRLYEAENLSLVVVMYCQIVLCRWFSHSVLPPDHQAMAYGAGTNRAVHRDLVWKASHI